MILTITLNPALDKSTTIPKLIPEKKMRCTDMQVEAGGGGINVSKVVKELEGEGIALFPSGGMNGKIDRKSTRLNSSHGYISYAVFCLKKKNKTKNNISNEDIT